LAQAGEGRESIVNYKYGLIIGKFDPFHLGHKALIDFGTSHCEKLTVAVTESDDDVFNIRQRVIAIRRDCPKLTVETIGDIYLDEDSGAWARHALKWCSIKKLPYPNVVFTSEDYGDAFAKEISVLQGSPCMHLLFDKQRAIVPVSGSLLKKELYQYWQYLAPAMKRLLLKHVVVLGAESTGTTTLARALAQHYKTVYVPEIGETYTYGKYVAGIIPWNAEDFASIVKMQKLAANSLALSAKYLMIHDTDALATTVWQQRYLGGELPNPPKNISAQTVYIITSPNGVPFAQNGIRDGKHLRLKMHDTFVSVVSKTKNKYLVVEGSVEERVRRCVEFIENGLIIVK